MKIGFIKRISAFALFITIVCSLCGCAVFPLFKDPTIYTSEYFEFFIDYVPGYYKEATTSKKAAFIVGLTYSGKQQEALEIPRELRGYPVMFLGGKYYTSFTDKYYEIESDNLKKLYVHDSVVRVYYQSFDKMRGHLDIMLCDGADYYEPYKNLYPRKTYYIYKAEFEASEYDENFAPANVAFYYNYDFSPNGGRYWLDNALEGETIPTPPAPTRDGYVFAGWYLEPECVNARSFDGMPEIAEGEELALYAAWERA